MSNRQEYKMTQDQLDRLMEASRPVAYIIANGTAPSSPQERANKAWERLGIELGFDWNTVSPCGKGDLWFTAIPAPTQANANG